MPNKQKQTSRRSNLSISQTNLESNITTNLVKRVPSTIATLRNESKSAFKIIALDLYI